MSTAIFDFNPATVDWEKPPLAGWKYDSPQKKWFQGSFRTVHRLTRTCPTCSELITLDCTVAALEGKALNHGLALRRCKKCRKALKHDKGGYAERKAQGEAVAPVVIVEGTDELHTLRMKCQTMEQELSGLYVANKTLRETVDDQAKRLAKYELPAALKEAGAGLPWSAQQ